MSTTVRKVVASYQKTIYPLKQKSSLFKVSSSVYIRVRLSYQDDFLSLDRLFCYFIALKAGYEIQKENNY